jgi:hypothetical protein
LCVGIDVWMVGWVLGWMLGLISGTTKFMSKFGKFMARKYLCQISADLWNKNIYVKFRQIYVKIVALANFFIY